jgi:hypothetical protein
MCKCKPKNLREFEPILKLEVVVVILCMGMGRIILQ